MRQHLSADGIRRNKINLPLGETKWYVERIDGERNGRYTVKAQEGRKEGRKERRKEGREKWENATHTQNRGYLRLSPHRLFSSPRPTLGILIDPPLLPFEIREHAEISVEKDA